MDEVENVKSCPWCCGDIREDQVTGDERCAYCGHSLLVARHIRALAATTLWAKTERLLLPRPEDATGIPAAA